MTPGEETQIAVDRLMIELEDMAENITRGLIGGELDADRTEVSEDDYRDYRFRNWGDADKRVEWAKSIEPEKWLDEAFDIIAPAASKAVRSEYAKMLAAGVDAMKATEIAQQLHDAEQMRQDALHPDPDQPPAILAAMMPPALMPAPLPPPPMMTMPPALPMEGLVPPPAAPMGAPLMNTGGFVPPGMG